MDCIVTAGGMPTEDDPLYTYTQGKPKALLEFEGRTMLERVMDALQSSKYVDRIVLVGLEELFDMQFKRPVDHMLPDHGSMVGNVLAGLRWLQQDKPDMGEVLFCTSDLPAMTAANVDEFIEGCQPFDKGIYYVLVPREAMEARFPQSNRTYVKLKGLEVAGGDMAIAKAELADQNEELWRALTEARKHAWKLANMVGFTFLIKFLFRRLSTQDIEQKVLQTLGQPVGIVLDAPPEIAMDVDKPAQVDLLRTDIRGRKIS